MSTPEGRKKVREQRDWGDRASNARRKRKREARGDTTTQPRPDWMEDPSLLPKRPPGRTA